jgi:zinc transporter, ZIP family
MTTQSVLIAFGLTLFAGLATGIGSLLTLLTRRTNKKFMAISLGFSAGFMIYVSLVEIFDLARRMLSSELGVKPGGWLTAGAFFAGMGLIALIDRLVPTVENPHEMRQIEDMEACELPGSGTGGSDGNGSSGARSQPMLRLGFLTALAIAIHNFPEGLATFATGLQSLKLGVAIAIAIAIHNIPEGIAVAIPIYCATGSRRKAFRWSLLSGLAEPLGALIGYLIFASFLNALVLGVLYAIVAGIMVYISLDELLPSAREYGSPHLAIYGLIGGMMIMAISLLLLV